VAILNYHKLFCGYLLLLVSLGL